MAAATATPKNQSARRLQGPSPEPSSTDTQHRKADTFNSKPTPAQTFARNDDDDDTRANQHPCSPIRRPPRPGISSRSLNSLMTTTTDDDDELATLPAQTHDDDGIRTAVTNLTIRRARSHLAVVWNPERPTPTTTTTTTTTTTGSDLPMSSSCSSSSKPSRTPPFPVAHDEHDVLPRRQRRIAARPRRRRRAEGRGWDDVGSTSRSSHGQRRRALASRRARRARCPPRPFRILRTRRAQSPADVVVNNDEIPKHITNDDEREGRKEEYGGGGKRGKARKKRRGVYVGERQPSKRVGR